MRAVHGVLKPTPLAGLLLVLLCLLQVALFSSFRTTQSLTIDGPGPGETRLGIGAPVTITTVRGATHCDIRWGVLAVNLAASYALAALLAAGCVRATGFRRPALVYGSVALGLTGVAFCVAVGFSKVYWGYFLFRPPVLREIHGLASTPEVIPVQAEADESGAVKLVLQEDFSLPEAVGMGLDDPYYCLEERLLIALEQKRQLPRMHSSSLSSLLALFPLIQGSGILATPDEGYEDANLVRGVVVDGTDKGGKRLVFLGLVGQQLSNDHYPYYELLFEGEAGTTNLHYVRGQRFFYDVAGIEGAEWYVLWPSFALVGIVIGFGALTAGMLVRRAFVRRRAQASAPHNA